MYLGPDGLFFSGAAASFAASLSFLVVCPNRIPKTTPFHLNPAIDAPRAMGESERQLNPGKSGDRRS